MRNITVAVGSFIVGAIFMSVLGNHTSTLAQEPKSPPGLMKVAGAVPVVPPFRNMTIEDAGIVGATHLVDGILCLRCSFKDTTFEYGGGEFAILNPRFSGTTSIKLVGAAENTATFLSLFGLLGCPANNAPSTPSVNPAPMLQAKYTPKGDFQIVSKK
jgi:hypothetical protein